MGNRTESSNPSRSASKSPDRWDLRRSDTIRGNPRVIPQLTHSLGRATAHCYREAFWSDCYRCFACWCCTGLEQKIRSVREAVGVFNRPENFQNAIDELLSSGFHRSELSLLASEQAVEAKLGHRYQKVSALADDPTIPRAAYVSAEGIGDAEGGLIGGLLFVGAFTAAGAIVASGGTLAAAIAGATLAGGTGGLIGSILAKWVGDHHAHHLQEQMDRGGLLLWVRAWDGEDERRALEILRKHSGSDVHVHTLPGTTVVNR
jgi:hypothetical protein